MSLTFIISALAIIILASFIISFLFTKKAERDNIKFDNKISLNAEAKSKNFTEDERLSASVSISNSTKSLILANSDKVYSSNDIDYLEIGDFAFDTAISHVDAKLTMKDGNSIDIKVSDAEDAAYAASLLSVFAGRNIVRK